MKLYLIRHAESEHNIAQVYAGVTDSVLTNHGIFQIHRLAQHFQSHNIQFTHVFASPLQRARLTAEEISRSSAQNAPVLHPGLVEKNFGFLEGQSWVGAAQRLTNLEGAGVDALEPQETASAMVTRAGEFIKESLLPLLESEKKGEEQTVAVVSHGITLSVLWDTLTRLCCPLDGVQFGTDTRLDRKIGWSNTGYLEVDILHVTPTDVAELSSDSSSWHVTVRTINGRMHLQSAQRTGGGIGSAKHEQGQSRLDAFFKPED